MQPHARIVKCYLLALLALALIWAALPPAAATVEEEAPVPESASIGKPVAPLRADLAVSGPVWLGEELQGTLQIRTLGPKDLVTGTLLGSPGLMVVSGGDVSLAVPATGAVVPFTLRTLVPGVSTLEVRLTSSEGDTAYDILYLDLRSQPGTWSRADPTLVAAYQDVAVDATFSPLDGVGLPGTVQTQGTITLQLTYKVDNWDNTNYGSSADNVVRKYFYVEIWDREGCCSGDYFMGSGYTSSSGFIQFTFNNDDGPFQGQLDLYERAHSILRPTGQAADKVKVVNPDNNNAYTTRYDWPDGMNDGTYAVTLYPVDASSAAPHYIAARMAQGWDEGVAAGITPHFVTVKWKSGYAESTRYDLSSTIYLLGTTADPDQWDSDVILHEYGHVVMDRLYGDVWPNNATGPHGDTCGTVQIAWTEGFATFFQADVQGSSNYQDTTSGGLTINVPLETPLRTGKEGDCYEFSVAETLWDIFDGTNDDDPAVLGSDTLSAGDGGIYDVLRNYRDGTAPTIVQTIDEFHTGWDARQTAHAIHEIMREHSQCPC